MPDNEPISRHKDLVSIAGSAAPLAIAALLARHGLNAETSAVLGTFTGQTLPQTVLYALAHQILPASREGREAQRVKETLHELGKMLVSENVQPIHLRDFIEKHPHLGDLTEMILREVQAETDREKLRHFAWLLKNTLTTITPSRVRHDEITSMTRALHLLTSTDLALLKLASELQRRPSPQSVRGANVPVLKDDLLSNLPGEGHTAGYLSGRLATLVQLGLLDQPSVDAPAQPTIRQFPPLPTFQGSRASYRVSAFGEAFVTFCLAEGTAPE